MTKIASILEYLKEHKDQHVKLKVLMGAVDSSISTVSAAIHSLRQKGYNIKSDPEGYLYKEKTSVSAPEPVPVVPETSVPDSSMSSRIIEYMKSKGRVTAQDIIRDLGIKQASVYALISQIRKHVAIKSKKGIYTYVGTKKEKGGGNAETPNALIDNFPWITMTEIMKVPESERGEMFEAMRKELFYRKVALAFIDTNRVMESTIKGARL